MVPADFDFVDRHHVNITGYGRTCLTCNGSEELREINIKMISFAECNIWLTPSKGKICTQDPANKTTSKYWINLSSVYSCYL